MIETNLRLHAENDSLRTSNKTLLQQAIDVEKESSDKLNLVTRADQAVNFDQHCLDSRKNFLSGLEKREKAEV